MLTTKAIKDWLGGAKDVDFHQLVADLFKLTRQEAKTNNFALVMGMGRESMAEGVNLGKACNCQLGIYWKWAGDRDSYKEVSVTTKTTRQIAPPQRSKQHG